MTRGFTVIVRDLRFLGSFSRPTMIEALSKARELSHAGARDVIVRDDGGKEFCLRL
jgi:hypothetical protein